MQERHTHLHRGPWWVEPGTFAGKTKERSASPHEKVRVQVWSSWCHPATPWENLLGNEASIEMKDRDKSLSPELWVSHQQ